MTRRLLVMRVRLTAAKLEKVKHCIRTKSVIYSVLISITARNNDFCTYLTINVHIYYTYFSVCQNIIIGQYRIACLFCMVGEVGNTIESA